MKKIVAFGFLMINFLTIGVNASNLVIDFSGQELSKKEFVGKNLAGANFSKAKLDGVVFRNCDLTGANFSQASLTNCLFDGTNLNRADFSNSTILATTLTGIGKGLTINSTKFDGATLNTVYGLPQLLHNNQILAHQSSFKGANLQNISFANIQLVDKFDFTGAIFSGAATSFEATNFGPDVIFANAQFNGEPCEFSLLNADMFFFGAYYASKTGLSFFNVIINGTNFSNAIFRYVNFNRIKAREVNLNRAVFINCKMVSCLILGDLSCTNFINVMLKTNIFTSVDMTDSLNVAKYTSSKITNSTLLQYLQFDPDGQISTNVYPSNIVEGAPPELDRFDCKPQDITK